MDRVASPAETARKDLWTAVVLLAVAAVGFASLFRNADTLGADFGADPGPDFVPRLLLSVLVACALALAATAAVRLIRAGARPFAPVRWAACRPFLLPALLIATLLLFVRGMTDFGFIPATVAFALLWVFLLGIQDDGRPGARRSALYVLEALAITAAIYFVFAKLILVVLP